MIHCPQIHWTIYSSHAAVKHFSRPCSYSLGTKQKKTDRNLDLANKKYFFAFSVAKRFAMVCPNEYDPDVPHFDLWPHLTLGSLLQGLIVLHQYSPGFGGHEAFRRVLSFASHLTHPCPWDEVIVLMAEKRNEEKAPSHFNSLTLKCCLVSEERSSNLLCGWMAWPTTFKDTLGRVHWGNFTKRTSYAWKKGCVFR